ncbi:hypothetical protein JXO59_00020, partial [candidate division KSB1 bacterium]|nr:hypothetical protein [candidate division KSB1 bacterium]
MKKFFILLFLPVVALAIGQAGSSLTFDGTDDYVVVADNALLDNLTTDYTMEAWINLTAYVNYNRIMDRDQVFAFYIDTTGKLGFRGPFGSPALEHVYSNSVVPTGVWVHVAIRVIDAGGGQSTGQMYINGVADGAAVSGASLQLPAQTTDLYIGNRSLADRPFNGIIDEVRIWTVGRTNTEIANNRGLPLTGAEANLLAYYKFNEGTGDNTNDATGNGLNGRLGSAAGVDGNDPTWTTPSTAPVGMNLTYPNGGEVLNCGAALNVQWICDPVVTQVDVFVSFDGGASWVQLADNVPNSGTFATTVPGMPTTQGRFRVVAASNPAETDDSDGNITFDATGFVPVYITMEAENANLHGSHIYTGHDGEAFNCKCVYSSRNYEAANHVDFTFNITTPGLYVVWARDMGPGMTRNSWRVQMDPPGGTIYDFHVKSNGYVWIWERVKHGTGPTINLINPIIYNLPAGAHTLRFINRENYTYLDRITITNNLNPGYYPGGPSSWIRITDPADWMYAPDDPKIYRNSTYEIKWTSHNVASTVCIDFSVDYGFTFPYVIAHNTPNDGSFIWNVPDVITDIGVIRISEDGNFDCPVDMSFEPLEIRNPPPEVTLLAPNGGENFFIGDNTNITWLSQYYTGTMNLYFSSDNGSNWSDIALNETDDGTYPWTVPDVNSTQCLVKVAASATSVPWDMSDAVFT